VSSLPVLAVLEVPLDLPLGKIATQLR